MVIYFIGRDGMSIQGAIRVTDQFAADNGIEIDACAKLNGFTVESVPDSYERTVDMTPIEFGQVRAYLAELGDESWKITGESEDIP